MNMTMGGLVILGGAMGFARKGSKASLIAGLAVGSAFMGSAYMIAKTDNIYEAHLLGSGAGGVLALGMGRRFLSSGKFMPAGLVSGIGIVACAYNVKKAMEWAPSKEGKNFCWIFSKFPLRTNHQWLTTPD